MKLHPLILALGLTPLVGCGGSSSTPEPTPPVTTNLAGTVADGYLVGATVCLDLNEDKICNDGEPNTTSTDGGTFTLTGVTQEQIDTYPLLVKIIKDVTTDEDNPGVPLNKAYSLSAPAGFTFVSPLTTLVQNEVEKGSSLDDAKQQVQGKLSTTLDLSQDYVAGAASTENSAEFTRLHQVAQVTATVIANNMEKLQTASTAANIELKDLITLISDQVFNTLAETSKQVATAAPVAPGEKFDPATIANNINDTLELDADKIEAQIAQNQAENSAQVTSLIEVVKADGINWFSGDTHNDGTYELDYGTLKLYGETVEDLSNYFNVNTGDFVASEDNVDLQTWVLSETEGWIHNNEKITSVIASGDAIILHCGEVGTQFDETITGKKVNLSGLNIARALNTGNNGTWGGSVEKSATFADETFGYKITSTSNVEYRLESHDGWCNDDTGNFSSSIKSSLNEICNFIQTPDMSAGTYINTLEELKTAKLLVDWRHLGGNNYNKITAQLNNDGSITFKEEDTTLASGSWSEITAYGKTFIKLTAPIEVSALGDHFTDNSTLHLVEHKGFVRQVSAEEGGLDELIFDATARDAVLTSFDAHQSLNPLVGNWGNDNISFKFNSDMTYTMNQLKSDGVDPASTTGTESGVYQYDALTGLITVSSITEDNNGTSGLSDYINNPGNIFKLISYGSNNSLTFSYKDDDEVDEFTLTAITEGQPTTPDADQSSNPLVGNWGNDNISFKFNSDMTYTMNQLKSDGVDSASTTGTESGIYQYEPITGLITVTSITEDNNGTSGLSDYVNNPNNIFKLLSYETNSSLTLFYKDDDETDQFTLTAITDGQPTTPTSDAPNQFTQPWLSGKTLYVVWFGEGDDASGNSISDVAVAQEVTYNSDGTISMKGLKNSQTPSGSETFHYTVDNSGVLRITEEQNTATEGNIICDNSHPDYLKTHFVVSDSTGVEQFDNVDLFFFDQQKALDFANGLSGSIPRCTL